MSIYIATTASVQQQPLETCGAYTCCFKCVCDGVKLHSHYIQVLDLQNKAVQFQDPLGNYTPSILPIALTSFITNRLKSTWQSGYWLTSPVHCHCKQMAMTVEHLSVWYVVHNVMYKALQSVYCASMAAAASIVIMRDTAIVLQWWWLATFFPAVCIVQGFKMFDLHI